MKKIREAVPALLLSGALAASACTTSPEVEAADATYGVDVEALITYVTPNPDNAEGLFIGAGARAACSHVVVGLTETAGDLGFSGEDAGQVDAVEQRIAELMIYVESRYPDYYAP